MKSSRRIIVRKVAGFRSVFSKKEGFIPSENITTISLSLESLKRESVAAIKNVIGSV